MHSKKKKWFHNNAKQWKYATKAELTSSDKNGTETIVTHEGIFMKTLTVRLLFN